MSYGSALFTNVSFKGFPKLTGQGHIRIHLVTCPKQG